MDKIKIKVCGMKYAANIAAVAELHPDYLGFIFYAKSPRFVNEVTGELIKYIPSSIKTTGVFVNEELETVKRLANKHQLKALQLHGKETSKYCADLKSLEIEIIKAFGVSENFDFKELDKYGDVVDYFLFDTQTAAHGGSGKVFDWNLLESYNLSKPYFLSGGIGLEQIELIKSVQDERLYAVDVNSKFENEPGLKDVDKLSEFLRILD